METPFKAKTRVKAGLAIALLNLVAACGNNNVYVNSENSRFNCERGLPETQRERCLERVMTAGEYHRTREEILNGEESPQRQETVEP